MFYRDRSPNGSLGRCLMSHDQVPIRIGTVWIRPGDVVVGDMDGVMVVPRHLAVAEGDSVRQITDKGGEARTPCRPFAF